jgi:hypothetical protein
VPLNEGLERLRKEKSLQLGRELQEERVETACVPDLSDLEAHIVPFVRISSARGIMCIPDLSSLSCCAHRVTRQTFRRKGGIEKGPRGASKGKAVSEIGKLSKLFLPRHGRRRREAGRALRMLNVTAYGKDTTIIRRSSYAYKHRPLLC